MIYRVGAEKFIYNIFLCKTLTSTQQRHVILGIIFTCHLSILEEF